MRSKSLHLKNINNNHLVEEPFKIKEPTQRKLDNIFSPRNCSKNLYHDKTFDSESLVHQKYQILNEVSEARKKNLELQNIFKEFQEKYEQETKFQVAYAKNVYGDNSFIMQYDRVFENVKKLKDLQNENEKLSEQIDFFKKMYSDESLTNLQKSLCFQKQALLKIQTQTSLNGNELQRLHYDIKNDKLTRYKNEIKDINKQFSTLNKIFNEEKKANKKNSARN